MTAWLRNTLVRFGPAPVRAAIERIRSLSPGELARHTFDPASASALFMVAFLLSASLGIVRQMLFSATFGAGIEASAYLAAFRLPETLMTLIGGGALSSAMIPVLLRTAREDGAEAERRLVSLVLTAMLAVLLPAVLIGMALTPLFVRGVLAPGFDEPTSRLTIALSRMMLLEPPLLIVSTLAIAVMNSRNQFLLTALSIVSHNVLLLSGLMLARAFPEVGIYGPTVGLIADGALQLLIVLPGLRNNGFRLRLVWDLADRRLREVVRLLVPNGISAMVNYGGTIVDTAAASLAREAGSLPALNNAILLIGLPVRLLGMAVGQSVFPRMALHAAAGEHAALRGLVRRSLLITMGLALPVVVAFLLAGRLLIGLLFERGRFDAAAADLTYLTLVVYALALPAYVGTELLTRALIALYDTRTPLLTNLLQVVGRVGLIWWLLRPFGIVAVPIAFALTSAAETALLAWVLRRRLRGS